MPLINPDTSEAQDMAAIEPGTYPARIDGSPEYKASAKGTPMIVPNLKIKVGDKERTRKAYVVISGPGAFNFDQLLRACNLDSLADQYKDPSVQPKPAFDTDVLAGQEIQVTIDSEMYEGQLRDRVKGFMKA